MQSHASHSLALEQGRESLRQQAEAFNESMAQYEKWMRVRLAMLWTGTALLPMIMGVATTVIVRHETFGSTTVSAATGTLFVEAFGIVGAVWRGIAGQAGPSAPEPKTTMPEPSAADSEATQAREFVSRTPTPRRGDMGGSVPYRSVHASITRDDTDGLSVAVRRH